MGPNCPYHSLPSTSKAGLRLLAPSWGSAPQRPYRKFFPATMVLGAGPKLNSLSWVGPAEPLVLVPASPPSLQHPINSTQTAPDVPDSSAEGSAWTLITQEMQPWNGMESGSGDLSWLSFPSLHGQTSSGTGSMWGHSETSWEYREHDLHARVWVQALALYSPLRITRNDRPPFCRESPSTAGCDPKQSRKKLDEKNLGAGTITKKIKHLPCMRQAWVHLQSNS